MKLESGKLNALITVERYQEPAHAFDRGDETWKSLIQTWAYHYQKDGKEMNEDGRIKFIEHHRFIVPGGFDITETDRISFKGKTLNIESIIKDNDENLIIDTFGGN